MLLLFLGVCFGQGREWYDDYDSLDGAQEPSPSLPTRKGTFMVKGGLGATALAFQDQTYLSLASDVQGGGFVADNVLLYGTLGFAIDQYSADVATGLGCLYVFEPDGARVLPVVGGGLGVGKREDYFGTTLYPAVWAEGGLLVPLQRSLALSIGGTARVFSVNGYRVLQAPVGVSVVGFL